MPAIPTAQTLYRAVDDLVKSWQTGDYVHHVRQLKDNGPMNGTTFQVSFSIPQPTKPVPEHVANATFTVVPPNPDDEDSEMKITYTVETQQQKLPGHLPIRKQWLDAAVRRKQQVAAATHMFNTTTKLPVPQPFVPGMYKAAAALVDTAIGGIEENEERIMDSMQALDEARAVEARNAEESLQELEELLVGIFQDADKDGNGVLDPSEFSQLLDTAELELDPMEKRQVTRSSQLSALRSSPRARREQRRCRRCTQLSARRAQTCPRRLSTCENISLPTAFRLVRCPPPPTAWPPPHSLTASA